MLKKLFSLPMAILVITLILIVAWQPITQNNQFFYDDWGYIQDFQKGLGTSLSYYMAAHNEHFMPLFKFYFFIMYKLFGQNIVPFMWMTIFWHILNTILFYILSSLIFPARPRFIFFLTLIWGISSVYYEVLHWISASPTALTLIFFQLSLILLHKAVKEKKPHLKKWSVLFSFFIPMNFSLGLTGVFFIVLYYLLILKQKFEIKKLAPYFLAWLLFLAFFYLSVYSPFFVMQNQPPITAKTNLSNSLQIILLSLFGLIQKSLGLTVWGDPLNMIIGFILGFNFVMGLYFIILYLLLNQKKERIPLSYSKSIALFSMLGIFIGYLAVSLSRTNLETAASFLRWGRYHYFPYFFACLFLGNFGLGFLQILGKTFNAKKIRWFFILLVVLYLIQHITTISSSARSIIRLEGNIRPLSPAICQLASTNTSVNTAAAI